MSRVITAGLVIAQVSASTVGLLLVKSTIGHVRLNLTYTQFFATTTLLLFLGMSLYVLSFLLWIVIVARLPLTTAYPIVIGLTMAGTMLGGLMMLGETLTPLKLVGLILILGGITAVLLGNE